MARGLVIPIKFDSGSLDGLELMAARVHEIRTLGINPPVQLLGIALFDLNPHATALRRQLIEELDMDFSRGVKVFETSIRHSQRAAFDMRQDGLTAIEYEQEAVRGPHRAPRVAAPRPGVSQAGRSSEVPVRPGSCRGLCQAGERGPRCVLRTGCRSTAKPPPSICETSRWSASAFDTGGAPNQRARSPHAAAATCRASSRST